MTSLIAPILLILALLLEWLVTLFNLPGNWLMVATLGGYVAFVPPSPTAAAWAYVAGAAVLAVTGELVELGASAAGMKHGGSRRGAVLAMAGALVGGIAGVAVGVPVPVFGSMIGALLGASAGAMAGAFLGEQWKGQGVTRSLKIGWAAFVGRLLGTGAKLICGAVIVAVAAAFALGHRG